MAGFSPVVFTRGGGPGAGQHHAHALSRSEPLGDHRLGDRFNHIPLAGIATLLDFRSRAGWIAHSQVMKRALVTHQAKIHELRAE